VLAARQDDAAYRHHVHVLNGFADNGKGVMPDLSVRHKIVRTDKITRVDARLWHKLVDVDRSRRLKSNVFQLILGHFNVGVSIDLVPLDDVVVRNLVTGAGVNLRVFDPVASLFVDLIEADFFRIGSCRIQGNRAGDEGKAQKTFPVGAGGHLALQNATGNWRIQDDPGAFVPTVSFQKTSLDNVLALFLFKVPHNGGPS
jgi:hypothetical protein